ncbi:SHOCT domain-containing protein [Hyphomicrobium sp.]|uniref:SHOCT domain-containing protein n=1 Tax=Hyphomicrobium sp. TaxID=82 RepID=UPI002BFD5C32|nr:SHOCT domain-containing protein [Hyphomicrobium sp.]HVZ03604.1 SHOCT domain-containing protein [Hyphomicrobium sp.]
MMHDWWTSGSWGMGFGWVFMTLPLALLVGLVLAIVRLYDRNSSRERSSKTAREILDKRFSEGEIDREEYEMRRKALIS